MKSSLTPVEQAQRLIDHARKISQELYTFSVELTEKNREKAQQKINYGKQVLNSLEQLPAKYLNSPNSGSEFLNVVYINYISVKPSLENALIDLQKRIDENNFFRVPEIEEKNENKTENKEILESDWKSPNELGDNDYSSILKNLIHAAEKELENDQNEEENEEESEEETEAEIEEESEAEIEEESEEENSDNKKEDHVI